MAQSGIVVDSMAKAVGNLASNIDRMLRSLREAQMAPMGAPGRSPSVGSFDHWHLSALILAFAAHIPSGSAEAVRALSTLIPDDLRPGDAELRTVLAIEIEKRARLILRGESDKILKDDQSWSLTLSLAPLCAWMSWIVDGEERRRYYRPDKASRLPVVRPGVQRLAIVSIGVLNAAGELCADTIKTTEATSC